MVFTCPSCYHIWKHVYPEVLGAEPEVDLFHATELLDQLLEEGRIKPGSLSMTVTYHDPCDLGRKSGVFAAPRHIMQKIPGLTLVEMRETRENAHCCGGGGNLESYNPELAQGIAKRRVEQAAETMASADAEEPLPQSWTTAKLVSWVFTHFGKKLSRETIRLYLKKLGFSWKKAKTLLNKANPAKCQKFFQKLEEMKIMNL